MRAHKLTDATRAQIAAIIATREAMPTNQQLADQHGVCKRLIDEISMMVTRGTNAVNATQSHDVGTTIALSSRST